MLLPLLILIGCLLGSFALCESEASATMFYLCESEASATMFHLCESEASATKHLVGTEINHTLWNVVLDFSVYYHNLLQLF
ncbi:hypothetical protein [Lysinibacillus xylanilyticus]|uniref:hypothetical protein n=1 Tax=Lysinibacillus xylanilyticus TaxID=582475 RepID=UPI00128D6073|nr:hypothetical protein [Lysinibacillus xylanilyticus]